MSVKLNLGCGKDIRDGWENYDMYPMDNRVKYINLHQLPLPFSSDYADEVLLSHILEHLVYRKEFMFEISRILKPGGICKVVLPCFAFSLDHKSVIHTKETMGNVCHHCTKGENIGHVAPRPFDLVSFRHGYGNMRRLILNLIQMLRVMYSSNVQWVMKNEKEK